MHCHSSELVLALPLLGCSPARATGHQVGCLVQSSTVVQSQALAWTQGLPEHFNSTDYNFGGGGEVMPALWSSWPGAFSADSRGCPTTHGKRFVDSKTRHVPST
ncbi:uncharacterized protein BO66DRAFT_388419 [Aspergillus aculeatinus CBS 121060]|uniref:Uncharacterized protein n=1 Tax=Aspergillus aculeatinus CBS 121060 TaxID=1448322 RepID=A0ACD1HLP3_9EURO|nr:hypothetical protein BO66DRAFT_388419 [Aspergillus aculeatinus CBS 121060]RAH74359.1 hypothetical protein BO66DRAFT_388419 [Aspergillus aculeatinus CBS 121060]